MIRIRTPSLERTQSSRGSDDDARDAGAASARADVGPPSTMTSAEPPTKETKAARRLLDRSVRELDADAMRAWLALSGVGPDDSASFLALLRRALPFEKWAADGRAERRCALIADVLPLVADRMGAATASGVNEVSRLLETIERGYGELHADRLRALPVSETAERRATAVIARAAITLCAIQGELEGQATGPFVDLMGMSVSEADGRPMQPDIPVDVVVSQATHILKAEAYDGSWFDDADRIVLPALRRADRTMVDAVADMLRNASAFRQWEWIEEECRYFGGTVVIDDASGRVRYEHAAADMEWLERDLAANERLHKMLVQNRASMQAFVPPSATRSLRGGVRLLPDEALDDTERHSADAPQAMLHIDPLADTDSHLGLTLVEWLRGYATLQAIVADGYDRRSIPDRLVPIVKRRDVLGRLRRNGLRGDAADRFVDLTSLCRTSRDLFDTPLIRVADGSMVLFGPALLGAIPAQTTLSRLASLGDSLEKKGPAFEDATRAFLRERKLEVGHRRVKYAGEKELDYDALVKWDGRIFLLECKCRSLSFNSVPAAANFRSEILNAVAQVHRLREGLLRHPEILDEMFGPGTSSLPVVMCVLNSLPFATVRPIEGVSFVDDSAFRRFFDSPTFNLIASGPGAGDRRDTLPARRLWSGATPSADDFERMVAGAPQIELAHHQIEVVEVETDLGEGTAFSRRCTWRPISLVASAAAMAELGRRRG